MQRTLPACIARPFAVSQLSGPFDFQPLATKQTSLSLVSSQFSRQFSNKSGVWSPGGRRHYTIFLPSGVHIKPNPKSKPKTKHNPNPKLIFFIRFRFRVLVSFRFCLSDVLRWLSFLVVPVVV